MQYDVSTVDKLRYLEEAKRQAVAAQDFEWALRLRQMSEVVKGIGVRLNGLEAKKREALERYDFAGAHRIKEEIDGVRNMVMNMRVEKHGSGRDTRSSKMS